LRQKNTNSPSNLRIAGAGVGVGIGNRKTTPTKTSAGDSFGDRRPSPTNNYTMNRRNSPLAATSNTRTSPGRNLSPSGRYTE
jgi:hypothetical protein